MIAFRFDTIVLVILVLLSTAARSEQAPYTPLSNITSIEVRPGWSGQRHLVTDRSKLQEVVDETNTLRQKAWGSFVGKPGSCVMRVNFLVNDKRVLSFILSAKHIIKPALKGQKGKLYLQVNANEIPHLRALLISIGLPERCAW